MRVVSVGMSFSLAMGQPQKWKRLDTALKGGPFTLCITAVPIYKLF